MWSSYLCHGVAPEQVSPSFAPFLFFSPLWMFLLSVLQYMLCLGLAKPGGFQLKLWWLRAWAHVSLRLALLFVSEGKTHYCCYVVWMWLKLFCKWSYFPFYPSSTDVFPCFPWKDTDCPFSSSSVFPFLSCSTEDLYMSQDMSPLRIYFI